MDSLLGRIAAAPPPVTYRNGGGRQRQKYRA
jgi:hypothetical protein